MHLRQTLLPGERALAIRRAFLALAGACLLLAPASADQISPKEYLKSFLDAREKYGTATSQNDGAFEVRGVVQGKLRADQSTIWLIRDDADDQTTYRFISQTDTPGIEVGLRVRALGHGANSPTGSADLLAIISEQRIYEWEKANTPVEFTVPRPAPAPAAHYAPRPAAGQTAAAGRAPAAQPSATPRREAPAARSSQAPAGPPPPHWRGAKGKARQTAVASRARDAQLSSRGWDGYIQAYRDAVRWFNPKLPLKQADTIARSIIAFSIHYKIDPRLIVAVIAVESDFDPGSTSNKGAMGLGQIMPCNVDDLGIRNPYDPVENIYGCVRLIRGHLQEHSGKPFWDQIALALASYNAGPNAVKKYHGIPPYRETQRYVQKVSAIYARLCGVDKK